MPSKASVRAWLDARGWPHDTKELGKDRLDTLRREMRVCGHRTRDGTPCSFTPMANGRCKVANGGARRGISHPGFKHGRDSAYVPKALRDDYKAARERIDAVLRLDDELALLVARRKDLVRRTGKADLQGAWKRAQQELRGMLDATRREDNTAVAKHGQALERILGEGAGEAEAWDGVLQVIEQSRKVVDTKARAADAARQSMAIEVVLAFYRGLTFSVREAVEAAEIPEAQRQALLERIADAFGKRLVNTGMARLLPSPAETE